LHVEFINNRHTKKIGGQLIENNGFLTNENQDSIREEKLADER